MFPSAGSRQGSFDVDWVSFWMEADGPIQCGFLKDLSLLLEFAPVQLSLGHKMPSGFVEAKYSGFVPQFWMVQAVSGFPVIS